MSFEIATMAMRGSGAMAVGDRVQADRLSELPEHSIDLIDRPIVVSVTALTAAGNLHTTPVWWGHDETHFVVNTASGRVKDRTLRGSPKVSIQVIDPEMSMRWVSVYGVVDEVVDEADPARGHLARETIDDMTRRYVGLDEYMVPASVEQRVAFFIRPTRIVLSGPLPAMPSGPPPTAD